MLATIFADNLQESVYKILDRLLHDGQPVTVRGLKTYELHPCLIQIDNPKRRTLLYPKRGNNPFATLAETLWVLAGRRDIDYLGKFLPRAKDFSDNGLDWRAGYGPRIRNWKGFNDKGEIVEVDQLEFVVKQIEKDKNTRQAIMTIWDPAKECIIGETRDFACSNWIHFMVRNDVLDCCVVIRSNDLIFGMSAINVYEFTVMQEIIANCLNINVGRYFHMSDSMHVYENFNEFHGVEKSRDLLKSYIVLPEIPAFQFMNFGDDSLDNLSSMEILKSYLSGIETLCAKLNGEIKCEFISHFEDLNIANILLSYYLKRNEINWDDVQKQIPYSDLKVSCDYWIRKNIFKEKDAGEKMIYESIERCK